MSAKRDPLEELTTAPDAAESDQVKGGMVVGPFKPPTPILTTGGTTTTTTSGGGGTSTTTGEPGFEPVPKP